MNEYTLACFTCWNTKADKHLFCRALVFESTAVQFTLCAKRRPKVIRNTAYVLPGCTPTNLAFRLLGIRIQLRHCCMRWMNALRRLPTKWSCFADFCEGEERLRALEQDDVVVWIISASLAPPFPAKFTAGLNLVFSCTHFNVKRSDSTYMLKLHLN